MADAAGGLDEAVPGLLVERRVREDALDRGAGLPRMGEGAVGHAGHGLVEEVRRRLQDSFANARLKERGVPEALIYWPITAGGLALVHPLLHVATYLRIAIGLRATNGALAWAHAADADMLGGAAYAGGFALCDASGKVTLLDATTEQWRSPSYLHIPSYLHKR